LALGNPQGRFVSPHEVADTVLWLCSTGARSVTGQALSISGGET
jgi:NAD(P)-dependent dehydrogenase (short-subunit alcohol dehydrogenase family)